jgi:site-specific DNA recombinase
MNAAIYTRVSTERQEENNSLPTQLAACRQYAAAQGYTIFAEETDTASGAVLDRPGLTKLRTLMEQQQIGVLIVFTPDRLSRNLAHSLLLRDEARTHGVAIHYVSKGKPSETTPEGELFENIETAFAEFERLKIRERMARGKRGKAESGRPVGNGNAPYGYRFAGQGRSATWLSRPTKRTSCARSSAGTFRMGSVPYRLLTV